jgi:hypothetical protein
MLEPVLVGLKGLLFSTAHINLLLIFHGELGTGSNFNSPIVVVVSVDFDAIL